jgi:hypothetical protein
LRLSGRPRLDPTRADEHLNTYVFEKAVEFHNLDGTTSQGRIDFYKRSHFVLEARHGSHRCGIPRGKEVSLLLIKRSPSKSESLSTRPN